MQIVKNNPAFDSPRDKLKGFFSRGDLFFSRDAHFCFVCGAAGRHLQDGVTASLRHLFIEHVRHTADSPIICIRAERAVNEMLKQIEEKRHNLSLFEHTIASAVDSVLVFPESPGSFAELGYFSAHKDISEKMLVAVKVEYQGNSFITLGPIHLISRISDYGPIPMVLGENPENEMRHICERLIGDQNLRGRYRKRYENLRWKEFTNRQRLAILDEMIDIVGLFTEKDLLQAIADSFGAYEVSEVRLLISLLIAMERVVADENGDLFSLPRQKPFMQCDAIGERLKVSAAWRDVYEAQDPAALAELARRRG